VIPPADALLNCNLNGVQSIFSSKVNWAFISGWTVIRMEKVSLHSWLGESAVRITLYVESMVPVFLKMCEGFLMAEVVPSPKSQMKELFPFVRLLNPTVRG